MKEDALYTKIFISFDFYGFQGMQKGKISGTSDRSAFSTWALSLTHKEKLRRKRIKKPNLKYFPALMFSGVHFKKALFVPNTSVYYKVGTALPAADAQVDLSWQMTLQRLWESLVVGEKGNAPEILCS